MRPRAASYGDSELFVEEAGLGEDGSGGGFAAGYSYDAEDGEFGERGAGDKDTVGGGIQIGRSNLQAVIEERKQIVGNDAFQRFAVGVA